MEKDIEKKIRERYTVIDKHDFDQQDGQKVSRTNFRRTLTFSSFDFNFNKNFSSPKRFSSRETIDRWS